MSVREMKAHWSLIEKQIQLGETFEVENHGRPTVMLIPAKPRPVLKWDDHLMTALPGVGLSTDELLRKDREGRW